MRSTVTISLPDQLRAELDEVSAREGVSRSDIVRESLRDFLFLRRFRAARDAMVSKAQRQGIYTDEDVFNQVS